jgi:hypothetical protein
MHSPLIVFAAASVACAVILLPTARARRFPQNLLCGILLTVALLLACPYVLSPTQSADLQPSFLKPTKQNVKRWSVRRLKDYLHDEGIKFRQPNRFAGSCEREFLIEKTMEISQMKYGRARDTPNHGHGMPYMALEYGLPITLFFAAYLYMLFFQARPSLKHVTLRTSRYGWAPSTFTWEAGKYNPNLQYTRWAYMELFFLIPAMPFSKIARVLALTNTFGTAFGINCLYWLTGYNLLREFGKCSVIARFSVK